jgi:YD repeat-containing protein
MTTNAEAGAGSIAYAYDLADRLTGITAGGNDTTFTLDALGRFRTRNLPGAGNVDT